MKKPKKDPFKELARFATAIRPFNIDLRAHFVSGSDFPIDLDLYELSWTNDEGQHLGGRCASLETLRERLLALKDDVERITGCQVDYE